MKTEKELELLRITVGRDQKQGLIPLYEVITQTARRQGLAGVTVLRCILGFCFDGPVRREELIADHSPVVIEIVDTPEKIEAFLPELDGIIDVGMIVLQPVDSRLYRQAST